MKLKRFKFFLVCVVVGCCALMTLNSCLDDDGYSLGDFWVEVATVKQEANDWYSLKLDNGATLWPAAPLYKPTDLKYNERALVNFTILSDSLAGYSHYVKVNVLQSILTKDVAENLGSIKNDSVYGKAPVTVYNIWVGDGFLNVDFGFNRGSSGVKHYINLIRDEVSSENPYVFEFRHNPYNDSSEYEQRGLVAFRLPVIDAEGKDVSVWIKVKTFEGDQLFKLNYNSDQNSFVQGYKVNANHYSTEFE